MNKTTVESSAGGISSGNEFRGRLLLILSAAIGLSASMNAVMLYSIGSFIGPLESAASIGIMKTFNIYKKY
jgi:hypothetical protein